MLYGLDTFLTCFLLIFVFFFSMNLFQYLQELPYIFSLVYRFLGSCEGDADILHVLHYFLWKGRVYEILTTENNDEN